MRYGSIYTIRNKVNGKYYVGQTVFTVESRWNAHINKFSNSAIHAAICKYGKDNFEFTEVCSARSEEDLNFLEILFIKNLRAFGKSGYNMTFGGDASSGRFTEEVRLKMRLAKLGKKRPPYNKRAKANQSGSSRSKNLEHAQRLGNETVTTEYNFPTSPRRPSKYREQKDKIISLYLETNSTHKVAEALKLDLSQVTLYLRSWGKLRTKSEAASTRNKARYKLSEDQIKLIYATYQKCNCNVSLTAKTLKIGTKTIYRALAHGRKDSPNL